MMADFLLDILNGIGPRGLKGYEIHNWGQKGSWFWKLSGGRYRAKSPYLRPFQQSFMSFQALENKFEF